MTALTHVRQHLEQARDDLRRECAVLQAQLSDKTARLDALSVLLADEVTTAPTLFDHGEKPSEENLTERAKEVMKEVGSLGVKPKDLTRRMRQNGLDVKDTFASNFLWRMKNKTQEVVEVGGRHFWKGHEPGAVPRP